MRERLGALDGDLLPDVPVTPEVISVEGTQRADGLVESAGRELAVVLEVDQEVEYFGLADSVNGTLRVKVGELSNPPEVDLLRAFS